MPFLRTQLRPREPVATTTTTTTTEMAYPEHWGEEDWQEYEDQRMERNKREKAYLDARGPLSLLQAVYCDPCKAKVLCSIFQFF